MMAFFVPFFCSSCYNHGSILGVRMNIKIMLFSVFALFLTGCTIGYSTHTTALPNNYRVVSIANTPELKADLLSMTDFNIFYNQVLPESCRGVIQVGDYIPMIEETTTTSLTVGEVKTLQPLFRSGECIKASKDAGLYLNSK